MGKFGNIDFHCDVLMKLLCDPKLAYAEGNPENLDVTRRRLQEAGTELQVFAVYIPEDMKKNLHPILESIDLFYRKVASAPQTRVVRTRGELQAAQQAKELGVMLSLEGADGLQADFMSLRILYYLGVRALGITWNHANWAADGVMEPRKGGLTRKGRTLVKMCNELGIIVDISHLSEQGFWDTVELTEKPLIASHSNAYSVCAHPRNLTDEQIRAIIAQDGLMGITFVPWFVKLDGAAAVDDVLRHIEHVCALGGEKQLMIGSDFDGVDFHVQGLSNPAEIANLEDALLRAYSEEQTAGFMKNNALRYLMKHLPK
jgi:membrane dipeptidase